VFLGRPWTSNNNVPIFYVLYYLNCEGARKTFKTICCIECLLYVDLCLISNFHVCGTLWLFNWLKGRLVFDWKAIPFGHTNRSALRKNLSHNYIHCNPHKVKKSSQKCVILNTRNFDYSHCYIYIVFHKKKNCVQEYKRNTFVNKSYVSKTTSHSKSVLTSMTRCYFFLSFHLPFLL
jgi:hypothetical protein